MKVVINRCYGGFGVSEAVYKELGLKWDGYGFLDNEDFGIFYDADYYAFRQDPQLIAVIEKLGTEKASGSGSNLKIVDIPDDVDWYIRDYDGLEAVEEAHRTWL